MRHPRIGRPGSLQLREHRERGIEIALLLVDERQVQAGVGVSGRLLGRLGEPARGVLGPARAQTGEPGLVAGVGVVGAARDRPLEQLRRQRELVVARGHAAKVPEGPRIVAAQHLAVDLPGFPGARPLVQVDHAPGQSAETIRLGNTWAGWQV